MSNPDKLAKRSRAFMQGAKRLYDGGRLEGTKGDMWFFELWHHLNDCAEAFEESAHSSPQDGGRS